MRDSGQVAVTELVQRLVRVVVTTEDEGFVGAPGAKTEVIFVNVDRQLLTVESVSRLFKNVVQG